MLQRLFSYLENTHITLTSSLSAFLAIVLIRTFFEDVVYRTQATYFSTEIQTVTHYILFYFVALLGITLILHLITRRPVVQVTAVALFCFPIILLPPWIDVFLFQGQAGNQITYILTDVSGLIKNFFTFYHYQSLPGMSQGIRVEFALIFVGVCLYTYSTTASILRSLSAVVVAYCYLFFLFTLPSFLAVGADSVSQYILINQSFSLLPQNFFHPNVRFYDTVWLHEMLFNGTMSIVLFLGSLPLLLFYFLRHSKKTVTAIFKNSRPERIIHYSMLIGAGLWLGSYTSTLPYINWISAGSILCLFISFWCAWLYAVGFNDCVDVVCDKVSNQDRPLVTGALTSKEIEVANKIFLALAIIAGYLAGTVVLYMVLLFTALYHVYSGPPLKLKRFLGVNSLIIGFCSLAAFLAGYFTLSSYKTIDSLSLTVMFLIVASYALVANVKDIKDIEGDKISNVYTIPVVFGERRGKLIISGLIAIALMLPAVLLRQVELFLLVPIFSLLAFRLIHKTPFVERRIFILYYVYIASAVLLLVY